jgi:hypothetical protein
MIFSENRFTLFGIMLHAKPKAAATVGAWYDGRLIEVPA